MSTVDLVVSPQILEKLNLNLENVARLRSVLRPKCGMCVKIFFADPQETYSIPIIVIQGTTGIVVHYEGIGGSSNASDILDDLTEAANRLIAVLKERLPRPFLITGHRLGGRLAAQLASGTNTKPITFNAAGFYQLQWGKSRITHRNDNKWRTSRTMSSMVIF
jgi:hypothetical protein